MWRQRSRGCNATGSHEWHLAVRERARRYGHTISEAAVRISSTLPRPCDRTASTRRTKSERVSGDEHALHRPGAHLVNADADRPPVQVLLAARDEDPPVMAGAPPPPPRVPPPARPALPPR